MDRMSERRRKSSEQREHTYGLVGEEARKVDDGGGDGKGDRRRDIGGGKQRGECSVTHTPSHLMIAGDGEFSDASAQSRRVQLGATKADRRDGRLVPSGLPRLHCLSLTHSTVGMRTSGEDASRQGGGRTHPRRHQEHARHVCPAVFAQWLLDK